MGASARCSSLLLALKVATVSNAGGAAVFILSLYILERERERETETCAATLMLDSREQHRFFVVVSRGTVYLFCCVFIVGDNASVATRRCSKLVWKGLRICCSRISPSGARFLTYSEPLSTPCSGLVYNELAAVHGQWGFCTSELDGAFAGWSFGMHH